MGREEVDQCESCLQEAYARERKRCEAEMQKQRRIAEWLAGELEFEVDVPRLDVAGWIRRAEQAVAEEFSPKA